MSAAEIPFAAQTAYADLVERCFAGAFEDAFAEDGTFTAKTVRGRQYWYFQTTTSSGRRQKYVGPETPELLERIEQHKTVRNDERDRRAVVAMLVRSIRLPRPDSRIGDIVAALQRVGVFRLRSVLVGTVAYQTYSGMLGVRLPASSMQTADVDIATHRTISLVVEDATPPPLATLQGLDSSFRPVPQVHNPTRTTSYIAAGGLRVDFLTPNRGADTDEPAWLPSLSKDAQPLRFLDYLIHEPVHAVLLHDAGVPVTVPAPERYALHKLMITQRRRDGSEKREKDLAQASALLDVLSQRRTTDLADAWAEAWSRGKTWRALLADGLTLIRPETRDRTLMAVGEPRSIVPGLELTFAAPPVRYDSSRDVVIFWGASAGERRRCGVSSEALEDHFGAQGTHREPALEAFRANRPEIEGLLQQKFLHAPVLEEEETLLMTSDVPQLRAKRKKDGKVPRR